MASALALPSTPTLFLSATGSANAYAVASANATQTDTVAISATSTTPSAVLAQLAPFGASTVKLVGDPAGFPADLVTGLSALYTVDQSLVSAAPMGWSLAASDSAFRSRIVVGSTAIAGSVELASTVAVQSGTSLLLLTGTEDDATVAAILNDPANAAIRSVGDEAISAIGGLPEAAVSRIVTIPLNDLTGAEVGIALDSSISGTSVRRVVVAPARSASDLAAAARIARKHGAVALSATAAPSYVPLLAQGLSAASSVGVGASTTLANGIDALAGSFAGLPAWRVTNTTVTASDFTLTYTPVASAHHYTAYDAAEPIATSTTTTLTIPGAPASVAVVAETIDGEYLGDLQYKVNEYATTADRATVVTGTSDSATHVFQFLGTTNVPRLISRSAIPVTGEVVDPDSMTTDVAVTCSSAFAETAPDPTYEYHYTVTTLSQNPAACEQTGTPGDSTVRDVGGVTFPATQFALERSAAAPVADGGVPATQSRIERLTTLQAADSSARMSTSAVGDDWAPITFRYQAFIPSEKVVAPGSTGDLFRRVQAFGGDNRGLDPNGSYRYQQEATVSFGTAHQVTYSEAMGLTHKYKCYWLNATGCVLQDEARAPLSELNRDCCKVG